MLRINVKKEKLKIAASSLLIVMCVGIVPQALAEELSISNNGADSQNQVTISSSSNTEVKQNNNADIKNDVKVEANTGENSASENTGGSTTVSTGDANSSTSISNTANISSVTIQPCNGCESHGSVEISGNGAFSQNSATLNLSSHDNVQVNQNARITNNLDEELITGKNTANDNTDGDVSILTGDIRSRNNLFNKLLNFSDVVIAGGPLHEFLFKVFSNGAYSDNDVTLKLDNDNTVLVNNTLDLINHLKHRYVTGENEANNNTGGDVDVRTGDIDSEVNIENVANISKVKIECDCPSPTPTEAPKPSPTVSPAPTSAPTVTPTSAPANPTAAPTSAPEQVLGAAAQILPVTGSNLFFFMLIGNVVMMLTGAYLRLRSGNAPGF